jgi:hypothetical protein
VASFGGTTFMVLQQDGAQVGWTSAPRYTDFPIPGSSRVVTQIGGFDLERLECQVYFTSYADYEALRALEQTTADLVGFPLPGTPTFTGVLLRTVGPPSAYVLDNLQCVRAGLTLTRRRP